MNSMKNITFEEIEVAATTSFTTRTLSKEAIEFMALLSGDVNPFHKDNLTFEEIKILDTFVIFKIKFLGSML